MKIIPTSAYTLMSHYASALNNTMKTAVKSYGLPLSQITDRRSLVSGTVVIALVGTVAVFLTSTVVVIAARFFQKTSAGSASSDSSPKSSPGQPIFATINLGNIISHSVAGNNYDDPLFKYAYSPPKCAEFLKSVLLRPTFKLPSLDHILKTDHTAQLKVVGDFPKTAKSLNLEVIKFDLSGMPFDINFIKLEADPKSTPFVSLLQKMLDSKDKNSTRIGAVIQHSANSYAIGVYSKRENNHFFFFNPHGDAQAENPNAFAIYWNNVDEAAKFLSEFFPYNSNATEDNSLNRLVIYVVKTKTG